MTLDEFKAANPKYIAFINVKKPAERVCINPLAYLDQGNVSDCPYSVNDVIAIDGVRYTVVNTEIDSDTGRCVSIYVTVDPRYGELSQKSSFLNIYFILTNIIKVYSPELVPFDKAEIINSLYDKMGVKPPGASLGNRNKNTIVQNQYERKLLIMRCTRAIMDGTDMPEGANRIGELTRGIHELTDRVWGEPSELTVIQRDVENYEVRVIETVIASRARRAAARAANAAGVANAAVANAAVANASAANAAAAARAANAAAIAAARARNNAAVKAASRKNNKAVDEAAAIAASGAPDSVYLAKDPPPGYKSVRAEEGVTNLPPGWILKQVNNPDRPTRHGKFYFKHETANLSVWTLNLPISGGRRRKTRRRQTRK